MKKILPFDHLLSHSSNETHGGNIVSASEQYGIGLDQWIDLSTGINPQHYPIGLEMASFQQLPYLRPEFITASSNYYQSSCFLPITGTQAAIQQLPTILEKLPVLVPQIGYQEHAKYWQNKGSDISYYPSLKKEATIAFIDAALAHNPKKHVVIINPNNPTGVLFEKEQLLSWARQLAPQAYLIVDEAFIDTTIEHSVISQSLPGNIIVLRSFGKFFGLAGIRLGYCFANQRILSALQDYLGLWQVNGPAQAIAINALQDTTWQSQMKQDIQENARFTRAIFHPVMHHFSSGIQSPFCADLFSSYVMPIQYAVELKEHFSQSGILLRVIDIENSITNDVSDKLALLRIGLLDRHQQIAVRRVSKALNAVTQVFSSNTLLNRL